MMRSQLMGPAVAAALVLGAPASAQDVLRIAAVVNDAVVSVYDVDARIQLVIATSQLPNTLETRQRLAPQVLRSLIDDQIRLQEAKRLNIQITKDEIDATVARVEKGNNMIPGALLRFLADRGVAAPVLIHQIEADLAWGKVVNRRLRQTVKISDEEVDEAVAEIEAHKDKPEFRGAEIFLATDDPKEADETRRLAERLIQQLRDGANFEALAQNFSHSASAAVGGDLGWLRPGQLPEEEDQAFARLQPGQISPLVRTPAGYYIVLLRDRREPRRQDDTTVTLSQLFLPLHRGVGETEKASQVDLARTMSEMATDCGEMERLGKELRNPLSGNLGRVKLASMPAPLRETVARLAVGTPSAPQVTADGVVVLMVCARDADSDATPGREDVRQRLTFQQLDMVARQYLRDLRRQALVDVRL